MQSGRHPDRRQRVPVAGARRGRAVGRHVVHEARAPLVGRQRPHVVPQRKGCLRPICGGEVCATPERQTLEPWLLPVLHRVDLLPELIVRKQHTVGSACARKLGRLRDCDEG